jgi:hypothetical protein
VREEEEMKDGVGCFSWSFQSEEGQVIMKEEGDS